MRPRCLISTEQWARIAPAVSGATRRGPKGRDDRGFLEAELWIVRTGAPWRDLPQAFGSWSSSYRRFRRWALAGRSEALRRSLRRTPPELVLIDSTIVKAHPHAAGALRKAGGQSAQALGRSRGGFTTKLAVIRSVEAGGRAAVILSRSHRKVVRALDPGVYRARNVIERWFGRLKGFRRVATRYDKTLLSYAAVVATVAFVVAGWKA